MKLRSRDAKKLASNRSRCTKFFWCRSAVQKTPIPGVPLQPPESYNLSSILEQVKKANASHAGD